VKQREESQVWQRAYSKLREMTVVVADTGDIQATRKFKPRDVTT
jgi:hypothetical protein